MTFPHRLAIKEKSSTYQGTTFTKIRSQWGKVIPLSVERELRLSAENSEITHRIQFRDRPSVRIGNRATYTRCRFPIIGINQGNKTITIDGDHTTEFYRDDKVEIGGSTGNDGEYTVVSTALTSGDTVVTVKEALASAVVDGHLNLIQNFEIKGVKYIGRIQEARAVEVQ